MGCQQEFIQMNKQVILFILNPPQICAQPVST